MECTICQIPKHSWSGCPSPPSCPKNVLSYINSIPDPLTLPPECCWLCERVPADCESCLCIINDGNYTMWDNKRGGGREEGELLWVRLPWKEHFDYGDSCCDGKQGYKWSVWIQPNEEYMLRAHRHVPGHDRLKQQFLKNTRLPLPCSALDHVDGVSCHMFQLDVSKMHLKNSTAMSSVSSTNRWKVSWLINTFH